MKKIKIFLTIFLVLILFTLTFQGVIAQESLSDKIKEDSLYKKTVDKIASWDLLEKTKKLLGFEYALTDKGVRSFFTEKSFSSYFLIGTLAGLWIWLMFIGVDFYMEQVKDKIDILEGKKYELKDHPASWFGLVAGRLWKVPLIGIIYAVLMQVPVINRILQVITFEFIGGWFWRSVIIATEIGFGPALIESYSRTKMKTQYLKGASRIERLKALASEEK